MREEKSLFEKGAYLGCLEIGYSPIQKKGDLVEMTTRRHLLSLVVSRHYLFFHSLSPILTRCYSMYYLSLFL